MIFGISKTTINGILAFLIATFSTVLAFQVPAAMLSPGQSHTWLWVTLVGNGVVALLRVWVGLLQNDAPPILPQSSAQPGLMNKSLPAILLLLAFPALAVTGCTNWERTAFQTLAVAKADIDQAQAAYEISAATGKCPVPSTSACLPHTKAIYEAIGTAKVTETAAVNQMVAYEQLKATGAAPSSLQVAETEVTTALSQLTPEIAQIKALYSGGQ